MRDACLNLRVGVSGHLNNIIKLLYIFFFKLLLQNSAQKAPVIHAGDEWAYLKRFWTCGPLLLYQQWTAARLMGEGRTPWIYSGECQIK